jgi:hypothetical protein
MRIKDQNEITYLVSKELGVSEDIVKLVVFNFWHSIKEKVISLEPPGIINIKKYFHMFVNINKIKDILEKHSDKDYKNKEKYENLIKHFYNETKAKDEPQHEEFD